MRKISEDARKTAEVLEETRRHMLHYLAIIAQLGDAADEGLRRKINLELKRIRKELFAIASACSDIYFRYLTPPDEDNSAEALRKEFF